MAETIQAAACLANGGTNPITPTAVFDTKTVPALPLAHVALPILLFLSLLAEIIQAAACLANGGINPITLTAVFDIKTVPALPLANVFPPHPPR